MRSSKTNQTSTIPSKLVHSSSLNSWEGEGDLLIIDTNSEQLRREGNSIGSDLYDLFMGATKSAYIAGTDRRTLIDCLGKLQAVEFTRVLIVGHGNGDGIHLASDDANVTTWEQLVPWLEPLGPECLVLVSCWGANSWAADALFDGLQELDDIYGTPTKGSPARMFALVAALLAGDMLSPVDIPLELTGLVGLLTGEVLRHISRESRMEDTWDPEVRDSIEEGAAEVIDALRDHWHGRSQP